MCDHTPKERGQSFEEMMGDKKNDPNSESFSVVKGYSLLASGRLFPIFDPALEDIHIEDIAHSLSRQCRWGGHTREFYSVAQHSCLVAMHLPADLQLDGLLHDASETYLCDVIRPIKYSHLMPGYIPLEHKIQELIALRFKTKSPVPDAIKRMDNIVLLTELRDLFPIVPVGFLEPSEIEPFQKTITPWNPETAQARFMTMFNRLSDADSQR
jgi:5'-deoxynucleotidase YfbR-like HD superfamily hydrolase